MLTEAEINTAYQLILGREADRGGIDSYLGIPGLTLASLRDSLMSSPEYIDRVNVDSRPRNHARELDDLVGQLMPRILTNLNLERPWKATMFQPSPEVYASPADAPFMPYSTCSASDFLHPAFAAILSELGLRNEMHRKLWEWVFVVYHLRKSGVVKPGSRGLVFGVGKELLPSLFASAGARITATDAPAEIGVGSGWQDSNEFSSGLAVMREGRMDRAEFERLVEWRECDMNTIDPALSGYDFNWSSCCFEHLGSLRHGIDFVLNAVEDTLRPGGVAVHTTEFNLTSNDATVERGDTCIYRRRDMEQLIAELRTRGHQVEPLRIAPDTLAIDGYVDLPPYGGPHLKLFGDGFVMTSVGLVIRRRTD